MHVRVQDINDNTPNCSTIKPINIEETFDLKDGPIGQIKAYDPDAGVNGTLTYRLQQFDEYFEIKLHGNFFNFLFIKICFKEMFI